MANNSVYTHIQMGYRSPRIAQLSPRNGNLSRKSKTQISESNPLFAKA
jgi:hypothetical protein